MQPVSPYKFRSESFTVFERPYFGSFALIYSPVGKEVKKIPREWLSSMGSFILHGKSSFTLIDVQGRLYCIKPKTSLSNPICIVPDIEEFALSASEPFVGVLKNCGSDPSLYNATLELTNCKEYGSKSMEPVTLGNRNGMS
jgi:hypothetical protein